MKFLTTNFLKCSVKACDVSNDNFPLQYSSAACKLEQQPLDVTEDGAEYINYEFLVGIIDRLDWPAVLEVARDLGNTALPAHKPVLDLDSEDEISSSKLLLRDLQILLLQTTIVEGEMKCKNCGHTYHIKNGIPNLLLPPHLA